MKGDLAPIVRIVSPLADSRVAPGEGKIGAGSPNGTGFLVNLEIVTRDKTPVSLREATNIRRVDLLNVGELNPNAPGLYFFFDVDLITPDGSVLPKFNNFASAFNIAGTDDTPGDGVTAWLGWHVLESVPEDVDEFTMTAAFVDDKGRIGMDRITVKVDRSKSSGQALTPAPFVVTGAEGLPGAPEVTMIAPRVPTSIALGAQDNTLNPPPTAPCSSFRSALWLRVMPRSPSARTASARAWRIPPSGSSPMVRKSPTRLRGQQAGRIATSPASNSRSQLQSGRPTAISLPRA